MMLVLDTPELAPAERGEALQLAISGNASASVVRFTSGAEVMAVLHRYEFGPGRVFNVRGSDDPLPRTATTTPRDEKRTVALAVPLTRRNPPRWAREEQLLAEGGMSLVDFDAPYEYGWSGIGSSFFQVDHDRLDLPSDLIDRAAARLSASPLYPLVRDHVMHITGAAHRLAGTSLALELGEITLSLMRALIVTAAAETPELSRHAGASRLGPEVLTYIRGHLAEPSLTPLTIAKAHNISVRQLYKVCAEEKISLESWIIDQRLASARQDLSSAAGRHRTIAATARAWCFTDPSFFSARFRRRYGVTPRESQHGKRPANG